MAVDGDLMMVEDKRGPSTTLLSDDNLIMCRRAMFRENVLDLGPPLLSS